MIRCTQQSQFLFLVFPSLVVSLVVSSCYILLFWTNEICNERSNNIVENDLFERKGMATMCGGIASMAKHGEASSLLLRSRQQETPNYYFLVQKRDNLILLYTKCGLRLIVFSVLFCSERIEI